MQSEVTQTAANSVAMSSLFGVESDTVLEVFPVEEHWAHLVPPISENYVFRLNMLRRIFAVWWNTTKGFWIAGPTGTGKSSLVTEFCGRMQIPLWQISCHSRMDQADLRGQMIIASDGSTQFMYGPLSYAMKYGHWLLLDEADLLDPAIATGLNTVLDGRPLVLTENGGEVIYPHPDFRLYATGNTNGISDDSGNYAGAVQQNLAFLDRFFKLRVDYLDEETETGIIQSFFSKNGIDAEMASQMASGMVRAANAIRSMFIGTTATRCNVTMSTRTLQSWAFMTIALDTENPVYDALDVTLLDTADHDSREAVLTVVKDIFG